MTTNTRVFSVGTILRAIVRGACGMAALAFFAGGLPAQTTSAGSGMLSGVVSNSATGANLEGAEITVAPGNLVVLTSRDGRFEIPNLAPGLYSVTASYSGLDAKTVEARVTAGSAANYDIGLSSQLYQLSKFVVEGEWEGNAL